MTGEERKEKNAKSNRTHALKKQKGGLTRRKSQMEMKKSIYGGGGRAMTEKNVYKKHI